MRASPDRGPCGRDGVLARHPGGPDSGPVPWEPVITRPDPVPAEEWRAWLDFDPAEYTDPEAYPDEEDYLSPGELDLTEAELAEIAEAAELAAPVTADDADLAGVARVLAAQAAAAPVARPRPARTRRGRLRDGRRFPTHVDVAARCIERALGGR